MVRSNIDETSPLMKEIQTLYQAETHLATSAIFKEVLALTYFLAIIFKSYVFFDYLSSSLELENRCVPRIA